MAFQDLPLVILNKNSSFILVGSAPLFQKLLINQISYLTDGDVSVEIADLENEYK